MRSRAGVELLQLPIVVVNNGPLELLFWGFRPGRSTWVPTRMRNLEQLSLSHRDHLCGVCLPAALFGCMFGNSGAFGSPLVIKTILNSLRGPVFGSKKSCWLDHPPPGILFSGEGGALTLPPPPPGGGSVHPSLLLLFDLNMGENLYL